MLKSKCYYLLLLLMIIKNSVSHSRSIYLALEILMHLLVSSMVTYIFLQFMYLCIYVSNIIITEAVSGNSCEISIGTLYVHILVCMLRICIHNNKRYFITYLSTYVYQHLSLHYNNIKSIILIRYGC